MIKTMVTGGAGFIGSHLVDELSARGYRVAVIDDLSTGHMDNIQPLIDSGQVEFTLGSITDLPLLVSLFKDVKLVFHVAAVASVPRSIDNPRLSHEANATGTLNVLVAARENGVAKVVYSSSSSVYGDTPTLPKKEDMPPSPQSPYAVSKLTGELYCHVFQQIYGLPTVALRYFNVYGPRQDANSAYAAVIPAFIAALSNENPPVIFGDGEQTRDFTFVKDAVLANILAAESDATGVFNIGSGERISINKLAELAIRLTGKDSQPVHREPRAGDVLHSLADVSRSSAFGFKPRFSLEGGLRETLRLFKHE